MPAYRLQLLGRPALFRDEEEVSFPTKKTLALLAYLATEGGLQPRAKLAALFWPDSDDPRARGALRYTLTALRSGVGALDGLVATRDAVGFERAPRDLVLDVTALERVHDAVRDRDPAGGPMPTAASVLALCEAELMAGFSLPGCSDFEEWLSRRRAHVARRMEQVLSRLSEDREARGAVDEAIALAGRWRELAPLEEAAHRRLMRLELARGDRVAALRAYEACRSVLASELGAAPSPETEALVTAARDELVSTSPRCAVTPTDRPDEPLREPPLVGRIREFEILAERYHAVAQGRFELVLLTGEAGIGKTRLTSELLAWASSQGADVLQGRAFEAGGRLPYQPLVDAVRPRVERENAPDDLLDDIWLVELSRLLAELRERYPDLPPPGAEDGTSRTRLFEAITRLVAAFAARSPVVLAVDDIQWADAASLDVLQYGVGRWRAAGARVLLLLIARSEAATALPAWTLGLDRTVPVTRVELGLLRLQDTERMILALTDGARHGEAFAAWLHAETAGQPFFIAETLRALLEAGHLAARRDDARLVLDIRPGLERDAAVCSLLAPGIQALVRARVERLGAAPRGLLTAAAVLGHGFTFEQMRQVAEVAENDALTAADELVRTQLLREATGPSSGAAVFHFSHDKIRDVVYADATDARRRVFHRRALALLRASGAPAAEIARHAAAAGLDEATALASVDAGIDAVRVLAAGDAVVHFTRAIELAQRLARLDLLLDAQLRRAKARASIGHWGEARGDLEAVLERLDPVATERRAEILVDLAEAGFWTLDVPVVHARASAASELAQESDRADLQMAAWGWLAAAHAADGATTGAIEHYERAVELARRRGLAPPAHVLTLHSLALYWHGRLDEASSRSRAAVEIARASQDVSIMLYSLSHLGLSMSARGRHGEARAAFEEARRYGREYRIGSLLARATAMFAGAHLDTFEFAAAEDLSLEAYELSRSAAWPPAGASARIDLLFNYVRRGDVGRAEELEGKVAETVSQAAGFHGWLWRLRLDQGRAEIALARGAYRDAIEHARRVVERSSATHRVKYRVLALVTHARALVGLGDRRAAREMLSEATALARTTDDPSLFVRAATALLAVDGNDALLADARAAVRRVGSAIPDARSRAAYERGVRECLGAGAVVDGDEPRLDAAR